MTKFFKGAFLGILILGASFAFAADVNLTIRSGNEIIFEGPVTLPTGVTTIEDSEGDEHEIDEDSVLAVVAAADEASEAFEISDITYFSSFGSLYLKCITAGNELCDNWQYVVNGTAPGVGIDQKTVSGGADIYLYFGPVSRIELSKDVIKPEESVTVFAQKYDYEHDSWIIREDVTVGLTQPNPDDPFSPLEIMTDEVDSNGQVIFENIPLGTYNVGIQEDFYFPTEELIVSNVSSSGGSSSSKTKNAGTGEVLGAETSASFDLKKAYDFLIAQQKEDGSFGEPLYTDWAAIALATGNNQQSVIKLLTYLGQSNLPNPRLTDYERRAMALMALGGNPYNTNGVNYIGEILKAFDGTQFGDANEDNDDIFGMLVLLNAGYGFEDEALDKSLEFILSRQRENGSWDESIDMTGAALVLLSQAEESDAVASANLKAKEFLKEAQRHRNDGSWSASASSTAWALEGIKALGEQGIDWTRSDSTPGEFLGTLQEADGGIKNETLNNRIWETSYVISALSDKTWPELMQKFTKRETPILAIKPAAPLAPKSPLPLAEPGPQSLQNTAAAVLSTEPSPEPGDIQIKAEEPEQETDQSEPEQSWFGKLLEGIFGF